MHTHTHTHTHKSMITVLNGLQPLESSVTETVRHAYPSPPTSYLGCGGEAWRQTWAISPPPSSQVSADEICEFSPLRRGPHQSVSGRGAQSVSAQFLQSSPTLCDPVDGSPPGSSVHGISQSRILEWVAISSSRGSSLLRDQTHASYGNCNGRWILYR